MKNILVPTDFSANAFDALMFATLLYKDQPCTFYVLHTFEVNTPMLTSRLDTAKGQRLYEQLQKESKKGLADLKKEITKEGNAHHHIFETISISKELISTISRTIAAKKIDLVVMGTKGATGAKKLFMGSNTVNVIKEIRQCPILAVPVAVKPHEDMKIGFPTDLNHYLTERELMPLQEIAGMGDCRVYIIHLIQSAHLSDLQHQNLDHLQGRLKKDRVSMHGLLGAGDKTTLINDFIEKEELDFLMMVNTKNSFMEKLTKEPIIKKMGYTSKVPFLAIPEGF